MRVCKLCQRELDESEYYNRTPDSLMTWCKDCTKLRELQRRRARGQQPRGCNEPDGRRMCSKCREAKSVTDFYPRGQSYMRICKHCVIAHQRALRRAAGQKARRVRDPATTKLANALRCRVYHALEGNVKTAKTTELLGCTWLEFRHYMQQRFKPGMTWDNYGLKGWHIGHIRDCCAFDLADPAQQHACFHFTNLEPQWCHDNWAKPRDSRIEVS